MGLDMLGQACLVEQLSFRVPSLGIDCVSPVVFSRQKSRTWRMVAVEAPVEWQLSRWLEVAQCTYNVVTWSIWHRTNGPNWSGGQRVRRQS